MSVRKRGSGVDFDLFDVEDMAQAVLLSPSETGFSLLVDGDEVVEIRGAFELGDGPGRMPTGGVVSGFRLIDDGDVKLSLNGLSLDLTDLLAALVNREGDEADENEDGADYEDEANNDGVYWEGGPAHEWSDGDGWQEGDDGLLGLFDVDPIQTGRVREVSESSFEVNWWGTVATFEGDFVLTTKGQPMSGRITGFELREGREVERSLDGLNIELADLLGAMARDEGLVWPPRDWEPAPPKEAGPWGDGLLAALLAGDDRLKGGGGDDRLGGAAGEDRLAGGGGDDELQGGVGDDRLLGQKGDDLLGGGEDDDRLVGAGGSDVLDGGAGRDVMIGGRGADTFVFDEGGDSGLRREADVIRGFDGRRDTVDLSGIDADLDRRGDQEIDWTDGRKFSGDGDAEALLRGKKLFVDLDGDGRADFQLKFAGGRRIDEDDFLM